MGEHPSPVSEGPGAATVPQGRRASENAAPVGWEEAELEGDPHRNAEKARKVREMFGAIARSYDLNNRVHSLWRDQAWRRYAVRASELRPGEAVLDVACGTGDLTEAFARAGAGRVVGLDYTAEMLDIARHKKVRLRPERRGLIEYTLGDAQELPFADASFDVVSIAFGIRNVASPARAIGEFHRVLRPGGRLVILEFTEPRLAPVRIFNDLYCRRIMPVTATLISRDRSGAYRYLPKSVQTFLSRDGMRQLLRDAGFEEVKSKDLTLGICACYSGLKRTDG